MKLFLLRTSWIRILLLICSVYIYSGFAFAGSVDANLNRVQGVIDDEFIYTLTIEGSLSGDVTFPRVDGLEAREISKQSQSVISFNGISKILRLQFLLQPERSGKFEIPPIELNIDGKKLSTPVLTLQVSQAPATVSVDEGQIIFIERDVSKKDVYIGEAIIVSERIYHRVDLLDAKLGSDPYPDDFQQMGEIEKTTYQEQRFGFNYEVTELRRVLVPSKEGLYEIAPTSFIGLYSDSRSRPPSGFPWGGLLGRQNAKKMKVRSSSDKVNVKALPLAGRRKDYSGLVGEFGIDAVVKPRRLAVRDNSSLTITIRGDGLTEGMANLDLDFLQTLKVYGEKPQSNDTIGDGLVIGERSFQYALVPVTSGTISLGELSVQIFNPEKKQYEDISISLGEIVVDPSPALEKAPLSAVNTEDDPKKDTTDLSSPYSRLQVPPIELQQTDISGLTQYGISSWNQPISYYDVRNLWVMAGLSLGSVLTSGAFLLVVRTRPSRHRKSLQKRALSDFRTRYRDLVAQSEQDINRFDYRGLKSAVMTAFAQHSGLSSYSFEEEFLKKTAAKVSDPSQKDFDAIWLRLEQWVYGPVYDKPKSFAQIDELVQQMEDEIKRLKVTRS